ncbi:hypothetical protein LZ31DRAFT_38939 [Colletotrichum somersetense]|nr:hypothetical protein LZ31DRAFT_38939 [Colletotrichum somersetense]
MLSLLMLLMLLLLLLIAHSLSSWHCWGLFQYRPSASNQLCPSIDIALPPVAHDTNRQPGQGPKLYLPRPLLTATKRRDGLISTSYLAARSRHKPMATAISNYQSSFTLPNRVKPPEFALLLPCSSPSNTLHPVIFSYCTAYP